MAKNNFLKELSKLLKKLPEEERIDILQDYEDHFAFGLEEGKTEEEIVKSLGSPSQIAKEILANYHGLRSWFNFNITHIFNPVTIDVYLPEKQ